MDSGVFISRNACCFEDVGFDSLKSLLSGHFESLEHHEHLINRILIVVAQFDLVVQDVAD